jgi:kumamolisin
MSTCPQYSASPPSLLATCRQITLGSILALCSWLIPCNGTAMAQAAAIERVALTGHRVALPPSAVAVAAKAGSNDESMPLTIVLQRSDPVAFERYLHDLYDPASPRFRQFLTPREVSDRFGPSEADYAEVRRYFTEHGLVAVTDSSNRMTLSLVGSRGAVENALEVGIKDYLLHESSVLGDRAFHANVEEPRLPAAVASKVQAVAGLSTLARPTRPYSALANPLHVGPNTDLVRAFCKAFVNFAFGVNGQPTPADFTKFCDSLGQNSGSNGSGSGSSGNRGVAQPNGSIPPWTEIDGSGNTIGLLQFETFDPADVADYIALLGLPTALIGNLSQVHVNGGAAPGPNQAEVLLDIDFILPAAQGAQLVVYDAPFIGGGSFQAVFNRMLVDGVDIISNSWAYCEDQTSLADVQSIDAILASAAASGVSVFNAAGDTGSTCLDGSANTIAVPSGSPHATAVGGSSQTLGAGDLHAGETWWDGSASTPQTGRGGFGVSRFFARPAWQDGFTASAMRSVPDVVANSDPALGIQICQSSDGGCPSPYLFGGSSMAAPAWAAYTAQLNQAQGANLGLLNPQIYALSGTSAFHGAGELGSDFAHVGLGSPNVNALHVALAGVTLGAPSDITSQLETFVRTEDSALVESAEGVSADGSTPLHVVVIVRDANGNTLSGKTVTLSANPGAQAVIAPPSAVSNVANGAASFTVTDAAIESVTLTASIEGGIDLLLPQPIDFVAPPAAAAGILAFPTSVPADGVSTTSITVTLRDAQDQPSPGKRVALSQDGHSVVIGPTPPVTGANGEIVFSATNTFQETVTYTAVDETDGDLPVPGTAVVTFSGSGSGSCVVPPSSASGFDLTPFANGFAAYPFFYGNVNWGCRGATDPTFDAAGNAYVSHFPTGSLYKFGPEGGSATSPLATGLGPTLGPPVFGRDGRLYATHGATTGNFFTGNVVELNPETGAILRELAANLTCPGFLSTDPLSGDLFFDDTCFGAGSNNPSLFRLTDPGDTDPTRPTEVVVYATLPTSPNGGISFAPDGTIFVEVGYLDPAPAIVRVSGTDQPMPPVIETVTGISSIFWNLVGSSDSAGAAESLIVLQPPASGTALDLNVVTIADPTQKTTIAHDIGTGAIAPDGCLYSSLGDIVYKIAPTSGSCIFSATNPSPALDLEPRTLASHPAQGSLVMLSAHFRNLVAVELTPVFFRIRGANEQTRLTRTDAAGTAILEYQGTFAGDDVIEAFATVGSQSVVSNVARITWDSGPHATSLAVVASGGALAGQPAQVQAELVDVALDPQIAIAGASLQFSADGQSCMGSSDSSGIASCSLTLANPGAYTLNVTYAGSAQYLPASRSELYVVQEGIERIFADGFDPLP